MYSVHLENAAKKQLAKLGKKLQQRIVSKLEFIALDPFASNPNLTKMQDLSRGYRLRIGKLRVIYILNTQTYTLIVWKIAPRGSAYQP